MDIPIRRRPSQVERERLDARLRTETGLEHLKLYTPQGGAGWLLLPVVWGHDEQPSPEVVERIRRAVVMAWG